MSHGRRHVILVGPFESLAGTALSVLEELAAANATFSFVQPRVDGPWRLDHRLGERITPVRSHLTSDGREVLDALLAEYAAVVRM